MSVMRNSTPFRNSCDRRFLWGALAVACAVLLVPRAAVPKLRPLVPEMLDNLNDVNRIGEGVALENFGQVMAAARELQERARGMREFDLGTLGLDPAQDSLWDAFLLAQEAGAVDVVAAAEKGDSRAVMHAAQQLVGNACLGCHASFRDPGKMLRPSVLFMTSFLSAWRDMNRGLAVKDYNLIDLRARDLVALSEVIAADDILETAFGLGGSKQRRIFRGFLRQVTENSQKISLAVDSEDLPGALDASRTMWTEGCIACHEEFRR
jgi:cytochrome c556